MGKTKLHIFKLALAILTALLVTALSACASTAIRFAGDDVAVSQSDLYPYVTNEVGQVPYVTGMNALDAKREVLKSGLNPVFVDFTVFNREITVLENWIVVGQPPIAVEEPNGSDVRLTLVNKQDALGILDMSEATQRAEFSDSVVMPNLLGKNLGEAENISTEMGLRPYLDDATGENRIIINKGNWVVGTQSLLAGQFTHPGESIFIGALKPGDTPEVAADLRSGILESQWYGTVTANFKEQNLWDYYENYIQIDGQDLELDLIAPFTTECESEGGLEKAIALKKEALPIGARVRVVMTDGAWGSKVAVHLLEGDSLLRPFDDSVNQRLIETGYWIPRSYLINNGSLSSEVDARFSTSDFDWVEGVVLAYLKRLIAAGNQSLIDRTGGMRICAVQAGRYAREAAALQRESDAQMREYERTHPFWLYRRGGSCADGSRDGDGDGICHEG